MRRVRIVVTLLSLLTFSVQVSAATLFPFCEHSDEGSAEVSMSEHAHHSMAANSSTDDQRINNLVCDCQDGCGVGCTHVSTPTVIETVLPAMPQNDASRYLVALPTGLHDAYPEPFLRPPTSLQI